ncbi:tetratricopeptide repeat protein, partial [candidate division WOR-3 bacterium]|nr:tetratricopeptide repeat protein [candidate division WOR-3 bacterium]MBD3363885.1 tetratricopeptide repeat protein [candidate division WOR-3 bacterium]
MRKRNQLTRSLSLLLTLVAFSLPQAGRTQVAVTEEFEGKIEEVKPDRLFHPILDTASIWLTSEQESQIRNLISAIDDITIQDALENVIILDLYFEGEYAEVINEARSYISRYSEGDPVFRPHILFTLAEAQYYQGNYNEAKDLYRVIRDEHSRYSEIYPHARHGLAWSYMHLGRYGEASNEFYECGVTDELTVSMLFGYGVTKYNEGKYPDAIESLIYLYDAVRYKEEEDDTLILRPSAEELAKELLPRAIYYTGLSYYRLNELDSAVRYARIVADDYSWDSIAPIATYQTAWWSFLNGKYDRAIEYFNKSLNVVSGLEVINQDSASIFLMRAQSYYNSEDIESAMSSYRIIIQDTSLQKAKAEAIKGLDACYAYVADSSFSDPTVMEDSLTRLLEHWEKEIPKVKTQDDYLSQANLAHFMVRFAAEYYEKQNYEKVLKWTSKVISIGNYADEYDLYDARKLRILTYKDMEDWEGLAREAEQFLKTFEVGKASDAELGILLFIGVAQEERGDDLYNSNNEVEARRHYREAVEMYSRWLEEAPPDNPRREE